MCGTTSSFICLVVWTTILATNKLFVIADTPSEEMQKFIDECAKFEVSSISLALTTSLSHLRKHNVN